MSTPHSPKPRPALVVALSSRALFDFDADTEQFERERAALPSPPPWEDHFMEFQRQRLESSVPPGAAFALASKLMRFNTPGQPPRVDVVVVSRNDPISGMRVFRSAQQRGLPLERGVFTRGQPPWPYLEALGAHLFLSPLEADVRAALQAGIPAARVFNDAARETASPADELRIAFDGDAVLFSDEAERIYQEGGLSAFTENERSKAGVPLADGPLKPLLQALHALRQMDCPLRVRMALVTARGAPAHERALNTLTQWGLAMDEAFFLAGLPKGPFLARFQPDFFFDDQRGHIDSARSHAPVGHVLQGVSNPD
ncbi:5'-nucleotidase [Amphibiibacter pelophylacis]|uniref:5'-nucleotidase n=1 Tax=Amphibiibacter pelophylacis TaxID=1799477 RepID=A0ACC6NY09_9BURK